ncbi:hypothetical protein EW146_g208 [Bondarzewia mesenterica]|uniref:Essential protein Yae1 N-terminal domain-containing protein n=1 Tax=Bondarzewia mesenterica TaxID=1095465 RepID=A0A4S4M7P4_9AGAM|nr:hypothetical protein EW146_g208 [Bondarzewia mesenterica]
MSPIINPRVTVEDVPDDSFYGLPVANSSRIDLMTQLREAATTPTPLTELLQDPDAVRTLTKSSSREYHRRTTSPPRDGEGSRKGKEGGRRRTSAAAANSMLSLVLAEEERQVQHLKEMLRITGDRLEHEARRADQAESRATLVEVRAREANARAAAAEQAQHHSEIDAAKAREETKRYQMQLDTADRELRRVTADVVRLQRQKDEADEAAAKARDAARRWQSALRDLQAREEGREEGRRMAMFRRYDDGREDGWEEGRHEGWQAGRLEGFEEGRRQGREEGRDIGRKEERNLASKLYNRYPEERARYYDDRPRYIDERAAERVPSGKTEVGEILSRHDSVLNPMLFAKSQERIQQWAESTEESTRTPSPKPRPAWLRRTVTANP